MNYFSNFLDHILIAEEATDRASALPPEGLWPSSNMLSCVKLTRVHKWQENVLQHPKDEASCLIQHRGTIVSMGRLVQRKAIEDSDKQL